MLLLALNANIDEFVFHFCLNMIFAENLEKLVIVFLKLRPCCQCLGGIVQGKYKSCLTAVFLQFGLHEGEDICHSMM